jgi:hypothetical protein
LTQIQQIGGAALTEGLFTNPLWRAVLIPLGGTGLFQALDFLGKIVLAPSGSTTPKFSFFERRKGNSRESSNACLQREGRRQKVCRFRLERLHRDPIASARGFEFSDRDN